MDDSWLKRKLTVGEAENLYMVKDDRLGPEPVPFGFLNESWKELLSWIKEGDELWEFSSPQETWECMAGREGIVLIRKGKMIGSIITRMN